MNENPRLGPEYPHVTHWRCPQCRYSYRIAEAKHREWCMRCPDAHPLRLLTSPQVGATADAPARQRLPR